MCRRVIGLALLAVLLLAAFVAEWTLGVASTLPALVAQAPGSRIADVSNVDIELILAVDVSYSMDPDEQALQREGYVFALTSPEFLNALKDGIHGRVAVTYFEWAGFTDQKIVMPWRLIDGPVSARAVADEIARAPYRRAYR